MKKITFCFAMLLMTVFSSFGQVHLGNGTSINKGVPFEPSRSYSYGQSIYLSSEINATGSIASIQWYYAGPFDLNGSQELKVYIGHTIKTSFSSNSDWEPITNLTEVYTGGIAANGAGWVSVVFDTPFEYNGTDNLVIAVLESSELSDYGEDDFYTYSVTGNRSIIKSSNNTLIDAANPGNGSTNAFVPNIIFEGITQACTMPINVVASDPTTTGVTLYWSSIAENVGGSQYYITTSNVPPTPETEPTGSVESGELALVESGLLPATKYNAYVRDVCEGGPGTWSFAATFTTACEPAGLLNENFDSTPTTSTPLCWTSMVFNEQGNVSTASVGITTEDSHSGSKSFEFYTNGDGVSNLILISPPLSNIGAGTHRLKFFAKNFIMSSSGAFKIGTMSSTSPEAVFTEIDQIQTTINFTEYKIDFTNIQTEDTYIAIKLNPGNENYLGYIDDIVWEVAPLCPDVKNITVPSATTSTATINWEAGDEETQWEVVYGTSQNADPSTLTPIVGATITPTAQISSLEANTNYFVWVRSICQATNGLWMGPISFKTPCNAVDSIIENFDTTTALPDCWTKILRGETLDFYASVNIVLDGANSAPNTARLYSGFAAPSPTDDIILVTPNLSNLTGGTHRLKFYAYIADGAGSLQVGTLNSNTADATFTNFQTVAIPNGPMTEYVVDFSGYDGQDSFVGIRLNNASAFQTILIDDIVWEPSPSCPDVAQVSFPEIDVNSVTVNWVAPNALQWQVVYGLASVIDPNTLTPSELLDSPDYQIQGLTDNTTYKVWIRSICGEPDGNGAWSTPRLVTTLCAVTSTFNETFEGTTIPDLPSCWSSIIGSSNATVSSISWQPYAGTRSLEMYNAGAELTTDIILVSPKLNNLNAGTHRIRFTSRNFGAGSVEVGTINGDGIFTLLDDVALTDTYQEYTVQFNTYEGQDMQIGFRMHPTDNYQTVNLDNIVWEADPELSNVDFDNSSFTFHPNPVKDVLNLSYKQNITNVSVYNLLGQKIIEKSINANSTQVNMFGLASGSYIVKVVSENQTKTIKIIKE